MDVHKLQRCLTKAAEIIVDRQGFLWVHYLNCDKQSENLLPWPNIPYFLGYEPLSTLESIPMYYHRVHT